MDTLTPQRRAILSIVYSCTKTETALDVFNHPETGLLSSWSGLSRDTITTMVSYELLEHGWPLITMTAAQREE